jgi:cell division protein FtsW
MRASKENIKTNFLFFFIVLGITLFVGIMFVYSSLFAMQNIKEINPEQKFKTYIIGLIIGFIGAIFAFLFGNLFIKNSLIMLAFYIFLNMFLGIVLFAPPIAGVTRWMNFGPFQFQPSELAKLILPAFLAFYYSKLKNKKNILTNVLIPLILCLLSIFLIFLEPDLSTTLLILVISLITMFLGIEDKSVLIFFIVFMLVLGITIFIFQDKFLQSYQISRLTKEDPFQSQRARDAITGGGLSGKGPFAGEEKYYVPESYSDFIIAVIGEEWGKIGIAIVVTLFLFLCHELVYMAYLTKDSATFIFCGATASWIFIQVMINTLVGLGIPWMPVTGVTLPLMSYGNSSMIVTLTAIGWALGLIYNNSDIRKIGEENDEQ